MGTTYLKLVTKQDDEGGKEAARVIETVGS